MPSWEYKCRHCDKITPDRCSWEDRTQFIKCKHCGRNAQYQQSLTASRRDMTVVEGG